MNSPLKKGQLVYRYSFLPNRMFFAIITAPVLPDDPGVTVVPLRGIVADYLCRFTLQRAYWTFHGPVTDNIFLFTEPYHE